MNVPGCGAFAFATGNGCFIIKGDCSQHSIFRHIIRNVSASVELQLFRIDIQCYNSNYKMDAKYIWVVSQTKLHTAISACYERSFPKLVRVRVKAHEKHIEEEIDPLLRTPKGMEGSSW